MAKALTRIWSEQVSGLGERTAARVLVKPALSEAEGATPPKHILSADCQFSAKLVKNRVELVESPQPLRQVASVAISGIGAILLDV